MKLPDRVLAARVSQRQQFLPVREKMHRMRRLVAGDISALGETGTSAQQSNLDQIYRGDASQFWDILVTDVEAGRSNKLLQAVRTFAFQVSLGFPDFQFEDLTANEQLINSAYLKARMKCADTKAEARLALMDYLVGGIGAVAIGVREDYPYTDRIDPLDLNWDLTATSFDKVGWASWVIRRPLWEWEEMFPRAKDLAAQYANGEPDQIVAVACYYDKFGEGGNLAYFLCSGADSDTVTEEQILERVKNPYHQERAGEMEPWVPVVFMSYLGLPGVKIPVSPVEMMLPAQIALWESDRRIRDIVDKNRAIWEVDENSIDPKHLEAWLDGEVDVLTKKPGSEGMVVKPSIGIDQTLIEYRNANERELTGAGGVNPYASGNPVKDVQYAAQVNAIQGQSGLTASAIAKDVADAWIKIGKGLLSVGKEYDDEPLVVRSVDGDVMWEERFDRETGPVNQYLRPDADLVVSEDELSFKSKEQKIAQAAAHLQVAMSVAQMYPGVLSKALETYLRAMGERDIAAQLQPPQQAVDPAAAALMNTAA